MKFSVLTKNSSDYSYLGLGIIIKTFGLVLLCYTLQYHTFFYT